MSNFLMYTHDLTVYAMVKSILQSPNHLVSRIECDTDLPDSSTIQGIIYYADPINIAVLQRLAAFHSKVFFLINQDDPVRTKRALGGERILPPDIGWFVLPADLEELPIIMCRFFNVAHEY